MAWWLKIISDFLVAFVVSLSYFLYDRRKGISARTANKKELLKSTLFLGILLGAINLLPLWIVSLVMILLIAVVWLDYKIYK